MGRYSDAFLAGWAAAREIAQQAGSVPPYPADHVPEAASEEPKEESSNGGDSESEPVDVPKGHGEPSDG